MLTSYLRRTPSARTYAVSYTVCWVTLCDLVSVLRVPAACASSSFARALRPARRNDQALSVVRALRVTISRFSSAAPDGTHRTCVPTCLGSEAVMAPLRIARDACDAGARCAMVYRSSEYAFPRGEPPGDRVTLCLL